VIFLVFLGETFGDILGNILGDIITKYGASSATTDTVVVYGNFSVDMETLSLMHYHWRRSTLLVLS
jgi:hypothetical protein